jgi:UDP-N-acetylmuramoylalanine--D-glutamate ligase
MNLKDFKNKKITVMGIGLHGGGVGVIKFLTEQGAKVLATDLRDKDELKSSIEKLAGLPVDFVLGEHRMDDFINADMIIKNPGVPEDSEFIKAAREKNIPIESDIGIFLEICPAPIISITGTRGKSTTAALLAHILSNHFPQVILAGNIRNSVLEKFSEITKDTIVVLELSSWQLADAKKHEKSPYVAVMTNIMQDHQNRYKDFADYIEDKKLIFKFQKDKDYLFLNFDDARLREISKEVTSRIYFYSTDGDNLIKTELPSLNQKARLGAYTIGKKIFYGAAREEICTLSDINLPGRHNLSNVLAAISVADLYDIPVEKIREGLKDFQMLEGRLELIKEINGIKFINDTTATSPDAAIAAVNFLTENEKPENQKHVILIAGGADKNLDFRELGKLISEKIKAVILLKGNATEKLRKEILPEIPVKKTDSMEKAVSAAKKIAVEGDIILLSPGCASFGLFKHEFDRGQKFNEAIQKISNS